MNLVTSIDEACDALADDSFIALDLETGSQNPFAGKAKSEKSALNPFVGRLEVISMHGLESGATALLHVGRNYSKSLDPRLNHFFENHDAFFVGHNLTNFDLPYLFTHGVDVTKMKFVDTYICELILTMVEGIEYENSLQEALKRRLNVSVKKDAQGHQWTAMYLTDEQIKYCTEDVVYLLDLYFEQYKLIQAYNVNSAWDIEYKTSKIVLDTSVHGVPVDKKIYMEHYENNKKFVDDTVAELNALAGASYNWNSSHQIKKVFNNLGHSLRSTGAEALQEAAPDIHGAGSDLIAGLLKLKERSQLLKTYKKEWWSSYTVDDYSHPTFNQLGARTGRMSCSNPNFQQIPQVMRNIVRGDRWMVSCDYSQLELRVHAGLWGEKVMIEIFRKGGDVHNQVASIIFDVALEDVPPDYRQIAKSIAFLVVFGGGHGALQKTMRKNNQSIEADKAKMFIDMFYEQFPAFKAAKEWATGVANSGVLEYTLEMPFGYRRLLKAVQQKDWNGNTVMQVKPTMLLNTPTQGTASIIMKKALIEVSETPLIKNLANIVHDEIILTGFDTEQEAVDSGNQLTEIMKRHFYNFFPEVPCVAEPTVGEFWTK